MRLIIQAIAIKKLHLKKSIFAIVIIPATLLPFFVSPSYSFDDLVWSNVDTLIKLILGTFSFLKGIKLFNF